MLPDEPSARPQQPLEQAGDFAVDHLELASRDGKPARVARHLPAVCEEHERILTVEDLFQPFTERTYIAEEP